MSSSSSSSSKGPRGVSFAIELDGCRGEGTVASKESSSVQTWVSSSNCTVTMPLAGDSDSEDEEAEVPLRTVFDLIDRDNSESIDVREFGAILQAVTPSQDMALGKILHCFPTCVLRPRDAEDQRRLMEMLVAPLAGSDEEAALDFETFADKWQSLPDDSAAVIEDMIRRTSPRATGKKKDPSPRRPPRKRGVPSPLADAVDSMSLDDDDRADSPETIVTNSPRQQEPGGVFLGEETIVHPRPPRISLAGTDDEEDDDMKEPSADKTKTKPPGKSSPLKKKAKRAGTEGVLLAEDGKKCSFRRRHLRRTRSIHADWEIDAKEIDIGRSLGGGKFGLVREATWRGAPVAVKVLKASVLASDDREAATRFDQEVCLLANMRHPNILMFLGAVIEPSDGSVMVVTERLDLSLHDLLHDHDPHHPPLTLTRRDWFAICEQVAAGLNYLHLSDPPIIHRDIKPRNVLVRRPLQVKIADFGISIAREHDSHQILGLAGTLPYMSPELLRNEAYTEKVDVFSFAMVAYELLTRNRPWLNEPPMRIILSVGIHGHRLRLPRNAPKDIKDIINAAWAQDPASRPSIADMLKLLRQATADETPDRAAAPVVTGLETTTLGVESTCVPLDSGPAADQVHPERQQQHQLQDAAIQQQLQQQQQGC